MDEINNNQNTAWKSTTKYIVAVGIIIFGIYILYISQGVLTLLVTAALLAFISSPVIKYLQQKFKFSRGLSVFITYLLATIILLTAPFPFISQGIKALNFFHGLNYIDVAKGFLEWIESTLNSLKMLYFPVVDPIIDNTLNSMLNSLKNIQQPDTSVTEVPDIDTIVQSLVNAFVTGYDILVGLVGFMVSGALAFVFLILTSIYFCLDGENFFHSFLDNLPPAYKPEITSLSTKIRRIWEGFFRGQVTLMLIIGSAVWLGGSLLGLPFALVLGVVSGLLEILPNLGPTLATIPAVIIALVLGPTYYDMNHFLFALVVIAFYILVQFFENSFLVPKIMGEAVDLHPVLVLTGVFVGATVWGIIGALIAAPVIATFKEILGYLYFKLAWEKPKTKDQEPLEEKKVLAEPPYILPSKFEERNQKNNTTKDLPALVAIILLSIAGFISGIFLRNRSKIEGEKQ